MCILFNVNSWIITRTIQVSKIRFHLTAVMTERADSPKTRRFSLLTVDVKVLSHKYSAKSSGKPFKYRFILLYFP